jgi:hypothetical protein
MRNVEDNSWGRGRLDEVRVHEYCDSCGINNGGREFLEEL